MCAGKIFLTAYKWTEIIIVHEILACIFSFTNRLLTLYNFFVYYLFRFSLSHKFCTTLRLHTIDMYTYTIYLEALARTREFLWEHYRITCNCWSVENSLFNLQVHSEFGLRCHSYCCCFFSRLMTFSILIASVRTHISICDMLFTNNLYPIFCAISSEIPENLIILFYTAWESSSEIKSKNDGKNYFFFIWNMISVL